MKRTLHNFRKNFENYVIKAVLIALFVLVFLLLYFNRCAITFAVNNFGEVANSPLQVYYLDVGQASSTFIVLPNKTTMLIDTGGEETSGALVDDLRWILQENDIDAIDILVLTHSDSDHVGGAVEVLKNFDVKTAYRPKLLASCETSLLVEYDYKIIYTSAYVSTIQTLYSEPNCNINFVEDMQMTIGEELNIEFYSCQKDTYSETNAYSPFIVLDYCGRNFMFTGDTSSSREKELLDALNEQNVSLEIDFLQVSHHGSKYSSTKNFLEAIEPTYAFISAGDSTHPSQEVVKRLKDVGTKEIYVTKAVGTIAVGVRSDGNFVIHTCEVYVDIPCIVVVLGVGFFVAIFIIDLKNDKKRKSFLCN